MAEKLVLVSDMASTMKQVPSNFIRPLGDRPNLQGVVQSSDVSIPLIDLQDLHGPNRSHIIQQIDQACQNYGFFQVCKLHQLLYSHI